MGQFKPMVKMETTEPSVVLKLKKGGTVAHKAMKGKADNQKPVKKAMGGGLGAMANMPMDDSDARAPARPALSLRRKAMASRPSRNARAIPVPVRSAPAVETPVMKKGGKTKKMATGGVVKGNGGGYATGGVVNGQGGFKNGGSTGDVKLGNAGGYKKGGATKKFAEGGKVDTGRPEKMPQGKKAPSKPVAITKLSGTFKKGGNVKKFADGGSDSAYDDAMTKANTKGYNATLANETAENEADAKAVRDAMLFVPRKIGALYNKAKNSLKGQGAVTDTERTISRTVTPPAKKRGGKV